MQKRTRCPLWRAGLLAVVLVATACSPKMKPKGDADSQAKGKAEQEQREAAEVIPVGTTPLTIGPISRSLTGSGTLRGRSDVEVIAQSAGLVTEIVVDKGERVTKGQVLARLDDRDKRNAHQEAVLAHKEAISAAVLAGLAREEQRHAISRVRLRQQDSQIGLEKAKLAWDEAARAYGAKRDLQKKTRGSVSPEEVKRLELAEKQAEKEHGRALIAISQAKLDLDSAELKLKEQDARVGDAKRAVEKADLARRRTQLELDKTVITSTISGLVYERQIELGKRIAGSAVCYKVVDTSAFYLDLRMPEAALAMLREGQRAVLSSQVLPAAVPGVMHQIDPAVEPRTGTVGVRIRLPDFPPGTEMGALPMFYAAAMLRQGMFIRAQIQVQTHERAKLVPQEAIVFEDQQPFVYTVKDGKAVRVKLRLGFSSEDRVEVLTDALSAGDPIVVAGQKMVQDKSPVKVIDP